MLTLALTSKTVPLTQIEDLADIRLAQKISQQPGVGLVSISGGNRPAVRIVINPRALSAYGLAIDDIRTIIGNQNTDTPKGSFDGAAQSSTINDNDQLTSADQYRGLIIAYKNGHPVKLGDVATVVNGAENNQLAAWANRVPAVILNVQRQPGSPTSSAWWTTSRRCCPSCRPPCQPPSTWPCSATAPPPSAPASPTWSSSWRSRWPSSCW